MGKIHNIIIKLRRKLKQTRACKIYGYDCPNCPHGVTVFIDVGVIGWACKLIGRVL